MRVLKRLYCNNSCWLYRALFFLSSLLTFHFPFDHTQAGIGTCTTEEVGELKREGLSVQEIRELCKEDSSKGSRRSPSRGYDSSPEDPMPRGSAYGSTCACFAGPYCPLPVPGPRGYPCYCVTPYGSCQGQAR